jgi:hypothetical protein
MHRQAAIRQMPLGRWGCKPFVQPSTLSRDGSPGPLGLRARNPHTGAFRVSEAPPGAGPQAAGGGPTLIGAPRMSVTMRQMLEAGVHFGHQTRYWNPKMAEYIFGQRNKIHIVNLEKTLALYNDAMK